MLVSIIIVNYNVTSELDSCISSILQYLKDIQYEILVVDNHSPDRSVELLQQKYPGVRFFFLSDNVGFSRANNFAVAKSTADYILILNPDTIFIEDFITPIIKFIENHTSIGACAPMLVYKNLSYQNSTGDRVGFFYESAEALFYINLYRYIKKILNRKKLNSDIPYKVVWMSGACLILRTVLFKKINGFNPNYFLNYEDIDFCRQIEDEGFVNYYFPFLRCVHLDSISQKRDFEKLVFNRYKSRLIFGRLHYSILKRILVRFVHIVGILLRLIFTPLLFKNKERKQRQSGYQRALKLYLKNEM